ncbi:MAG: ABC-2 transporter permease [Clostridiales bacterium]|nr:ABC-2 transporter permease [Clostridiales bacterium]
MKGLLIKEFYVIKKYFRFVFIMSAAFIAFAILGNNLSNIGFALTYPIMIGSLLPISLLSYDENFKWNTYAAALPVPKKSHVTVKYLVEIICTAAMLALCTIPIVIYLSISGNSASVAPVLIQISVRAVAAVISTAIFMPIVFKFGSQKARLMYILLVAIIMSVSVGLSSDFIKTISFEPRTAVLTAVILTAVLYVISWRISIKIYEKRDM